MDDLRGVEARDLKGKGALWQSVKKWFMGGGESCI